MATALITGASSGIGEEFARHFAYLGYDLIIVARREERLKILADKLQSETGRKVQSLVADLQQEVDIQRVEQAIQTCEDLSVLVNNAGFSFVSHFIDLPLEQHLAMIRIHIEVSLRFCYAALPVMKKQGEGAIINVASFGGFVSMPNNSTYNAAKAFLISFSEALSYEAASDGITVQVLCPSFTRTEIFDNAGLPPETIQIPQFLWMTTNEVVMASIRGLARKQRIVTPRLMYQLAWRILNLPIIRQFFKRYMLTVKSTKDKTA